MIYSEDLAEQEVEDTGREYPLGSTAVKCTLLLISPSSILTESHHPVAPHLLLLLVMMPAQFMRMSISPQSSSDNQHVSIRYPDKNAVCNAQTAMS